MPTSSETDRSVNEVDAPDTEDRTAGPAATHQAVQELLARSREEVLALVPGDGRPGADAALLGRWRDDTHQCLERGVALLIICEARILADDAARHELEGHAAAGARVRVVGHAPRRITVFDGRLALVPDTCPEVDRSILVREHASVSSLRSLFAGLWGRAADLRQCSGPGCSERDRQVLRLLRAGGTDETSARAMEVSLRTYRRYVSDTMTALGATSRFQAGAQATVLGWI